MQNIIHGRTPGYRAEKIEAFDSFMQKSSLQITHPRHLSPYHHAALQCRIEKSQEKGDLTGNNVNVQEETRALQQAHQHIASHAQLIHVMNGVQRLITKIGT